MSNKAISWAFDAKTGNPTAKLVLTVLADHAGQVDDESPVARLADGRYVTWIGNEAIANVVEIDARSVRRWIAHLEDRGLVQRVTRTRSNGSHTSNFVILAVDDSGAAPFTPPDSSVRGGRTPVSGEGEDAGVLPRTHKDEPPGEREKKTSSSSRAEPKNQDQREDVEQVCSLLAEKIAANGCKRPTVTRAWRDEARRLIDRDGRTVTQVIAAINYATSDPFWRANILSMTKLREKYDQLRLSYLRTKTTPTGPTSTPPPYYRRLEGQRA